MWYQQFEDLPVWKLADELNAGLRPVILAARRNRDFRFAEQLRGAALSVTNNIAEGFKRESLPEFINFLRIAKGSSGEVRSMVNVAIREEMLPIEDLTALRNLALQGSRHLAQFMKFLRTKARKN